VIDLTSRRAGSVRDIDEDLHLVKWHAELLSMTLTTMHQTCREMAVVAPRVTPNRYCRRTTWPFPPGG
jgi:hypothetical protein